MTMPNMLLLRNQEDLLELMHIKERQNMRRGVERLETYLKELDRYGLITWQKEREAYRIWRQYDPA